LDIVGTMQPISAEEIRLEIEEDEDRILSRVQVRKQLEQMCEHHILTRVTLPNDRIVYVMDRK
jgi:Fe2+ or Zn2+ uptake regulation protein